MEKKVKNKNSISSLIIFIKNNPRYRALFIMGAYFVFFAIVIAMFSPSNYQPKTPVIEDEVVDVLEKYKVLTNYNFQYQITYIENEDILISNYNGESLSETINIYDDNHQYLFENSILYQIVDESKEEVDNKIVLSSLNFTPNYIYDLIKDGKLESKTENYGINTLTKQYRIDLQGLVGLEDYDPISTLITTIEDDKSIREVIIMFEDSNMNKVEFNNIQEIMIKYLED